MYHFVSQHQLWTALLLAVLLTVSACATRLTVHPGALNKVDSAAYDALLIAETVIDQARPDHPPGLDALIKTYNVARESWLIYRGALTTTVPAQTYLDTLNRNLSDLTIAIREVREPAASASPAGRSPQVKEAK